MTTLITFITIIVSIIGLVSLIGILDYVLLVSVGRLEVSWKQFFWFANPFVYLKALCKAIKDAF